MITKDIAYIFKDHSPSIEIRVKNRPMTMKNKKINYSILHFKFLFL